MKINLRIINWLVVIGFALLIAIVFYQNDYVENEGFNPTDEGVILAQSWRIINGEIPHKDFISIRPVASGYLHTINFLFSSPIVVNARWFVIFQYFIIALSISSFLIKEIERSFKIKASPIILLAVLMSAFALTSLNYILYSWTTIDALFWTCLALPLIFAENSRFKNALSLFFLSLAALSRQTFLLISVFGFLYIIYTYRKDILKTIPVVLFGIIPYLVYFIMLIYNDALGDFIQQVTGRSEFYKTAILKFHWSFYSSSATPFNSFIIFISILLFIRRKYGFIELFVKKGLHIIITLIYAIFAIVLIIRYFMSEKFNAYELPYEIFFMLLVLILLHYVLLNKKMRITIIAFSILMTSWLSAISLGANTPIFAVGIMFLAMMFLISDIILEYPFSKMSFIQNKYLIFILSIFIFSSEYYSQSRINYHENSKDKLVSGLNYSSYEFGGIKASSPVVAYYNDLKDIYNSLDNSKNNIIVFSYNSMFYPVMRTRNPMSLDWLIHNEYIGVENRVKKDLNDVIRNKNIYFIVDKINVDIMSSIIKLKTYKTSDLIYNTIIQNCTRMESNSEFFDIYKNF